MYCHLLGRPTYHLYPVSTITENYLGLLLRLSDYPAVVHVVLLLNLLIFAQLEKVTGAENFHGFDCSAIS